MATDHDLPTLPVQAAANTIARALVRGEAYAGLRERYPEQLGHLSREDYSTALDIGDQAAAVSRRLRDAPPGTPIEYIPGAVVTTRPLGVINVFVPFVRGQGSSKIGYGRSKVVAVAPGDTTESLVERGRRSLFDSPNLPDLDFALSGEILTYLPFDLYGS